MSHWLVAGSYGMLGQDPIASLGTISRGQELTGVDRDSVDIADPEARPEAVTDHDIVVNFAVWTAVGDSESHGSTYSVLGDDAWQRAGVAPIGAWSVVLTPAAVDVVGVAA
jgi:dTDP-4-dehydrorhamnose reductase